MTLIFSFLYHSVDLLAASNAKQISFEIRFSDHHFTPQTLVVPAEQPLLLTVVNSSRERIEFESFKLNREKVVGPGETITLHLPPLHAGSYDFFDDFHQDVPEGVVLAK
jgi:Cupredoxin-like domain